ncbi:MAG: putative hydroxypyruvate isomerase [Hyphomicrobiales bacterium]|nr:putative hydroxypyruvate isomerase [Hyphomicrobiales bacterium]
MLFGEVDFADRVDAAAQAGFAAVECQFPYATPAGQLRRRLDACGLPMISINTPPGDPSRGEFGFAAVPSREAEFRDGFARAVDYALEVGASKIHCMSGVPEAGTFKAARATFVSNMAMACEIAGRAGLTLLIEPLNAYDRPGYFVTGSDQVAGLIQELGRPELKLLFDIYHVQICEGDLLRRIGRHWPLIGHFQFASVPLRREPDEGEISYRAIFDKIEGRGWDGFVGAEYRPRATTLEGLGWMQALAPR